jgi:hypothetical protein
MKNRILLLIFVVLTGTLTSCSDYQTWQRKKARYGSMEIPESELKTTSILSGQNESSKVLYHPLDSMISTTILEHSANRGLQEKSLHDIEIDVAKSFLKTEYVGFTLEREGDEMLVLNLRGLDCTTFLENVVVLSRLIKQGKTSLEDYARELIMIRYRNGKLNLYPSRLHYFADWMYDNEKKGIIKNITKDLGGKEYDKEINFMTQNTENYKQLSNDEFVSQIMGWEKEITAREMYYIPEAEIEGVEDKIQNGDLIAITSAVDGLDIAHVTIAYHHKGRLHIIHASSRSDKVEISKDPLADYVMNNKSQHGIMVARLTDI